MPSPTVRDLMSTNLVSLQVDTTLVDAARVMRERDIGDVVVIEDDHLIGVVTDRDIVVRAIANGLDPRSTTLGAVASRELVTVDANDDAQAAARAMRERAVRRVLVASGEELVGILSIGDLATEVDPGSVLAGISGAAPNT